MDERRTQLCVGGGCAQHAEILVHWSYSGETDAMCMLHAGIALQLADDAMALMDGTSTQNR
jgi:hypothetical protein